MSTHTTSSNPSPRNDHRLLIVIIVLGIIGFALVTFTIYITFRLKKRRLDEASGPYEGAMVDREHLAAQITPFGGGGPHSGRTVPQFRHIPGEDMRIAFRRPDGAWHFADSRTPFTPEGVNDIDVLPSPTSASASVVSFNLKIPSNKEREVQAARDLCKGYGSEYGFSITPTPPPPAYHRESYDDHSDGDRTPI